MALSGQGRADVIYGAVAAMGGTAMFTHTFSDRYSNEFLFGDVSTTFVPRILLGLIVLLSLGLVIKGLRDRDGGSLPAVAIGRVALVFGACVLSIAGVWFIGYLIAMPIGVFLVGWAFGYPNKLVLLVTAIVAPLLTWLVLAEFAQVSFPNGQIF